MDAGLAGVLGAAAGAFAAVAAAGVASLGIRSQVRQQAVIERERWLLQARRDAYSDLLGRYNDLQLGWWKLTQQLDRSDRDPRRCEELFRLVTDRWSPFVAAAAVVQIVGPAPVAVAARKLQSAAHQYDDDGTRWYKAVLDGRQPRTRASYHLAWNEADGHLGAFLERASSALSAPATYDGSAGPPLAVPVREPGPDPAV
jgi:hypothetical protein